MNIKGITQRSKNTNRWTAQNPIKSDQNKTTITEENKGNEASRAVSALSSLDNFKKKPFEHINFTSKAQPQENPIDLQVNKIQLR